MFHTARWDAGFDPAGKRVALIGTGASAVQIAPAIAPAVERLHLFQRTPAWVIPRRDRARAAWEKRLFARAPIVQALLRLGVYLGHEARAVGFLGRIGILKIAQRAALAHLRRGVADPKIRAAATPDYVLGCKRVLISNDYFPTLARDNVELVARPIARITPHGIVAADGIERQVDAIVFATGFAVQEPLQGVEVRGAGGRRLADDWAGGAQAYLGLAVAGYPNLFLLVGPNTGLGHNSMIFMIERQVGYVLRALTLMDRRQAASMAPQAGAQDAFNRDIEAHAARTVWARGGCRSWYLNAEGRNTTLWPGFTFAYAWATRRVDPRAFRFQRPPAPPTGL
jgi:cation diffusion facilitator CzcD-associated flavoprotein CzcO